MPQVQVLQPVTVKMDGGRLTQNLAPGLRTVTQDAADRLIAAGFAVMVTPRGARFTTTEPDSQ
jgi:hypothetical protein